MKEFDIARGVSVKHGRMFVMAGPCILESRDTNMKIAEQIKQITAKLEIDYIFKASFDKANRTSVSSFRGAGMDEGLKALQEIKETFDLPIVTDIHESYQAAPVAEVADVLQIPAFLCRQTDLLVAAGQTGKTVNVKKAQFLSAADMGNVLKKLESTGNERLMLCERGTMFGYNNLVVDFRNIVDMKAFGYPVVMDATHSTQRPGGQGTASGGDPRYAPYLAKCAALCGADGFFFEVHPEPACALSDAATMIALDQFEQVLTELKTIYDMSR